LAYSELVLPLVFLICDDQWNIPEPGKSVTQIHSNKENSIDMEDLNVNIKIKLSALWASVTLCYLYGDYFELYVPEKTAGLVSGDHLLDSPAKLLTASVFLAIPALMVSLSVLLKPAINRWLNIVFGVFFTAIMVMIAVSSMEAWRAFYVFLAIVESVLTSLIVWYAIKWPKHLNS
jgi:hypothetical protein